MVNWLYNNKEVKSLEDIPKNSYGFVYDINHIPSNTSYIGKKVFFHKKKKKIPKKELKLLENTPGRKPTHKVEFKESNWKNYWGSNKILLEKVKNEPENNFKKNILVFCSNKKMLTYYETKYLFMYEVLEKPDMFFNDNILGKFYIKDFNLDG